MSVNLALAACVDFPTEGGGGPSRLGTSLGLVEITITGIGTPHIMASASPALPATGNGIRATLTPVGATTGTGIQLDALSSGTFTSGVRGSAGSFRYIFVTFKVRNATTDGTAYTTARQNLTFIAVSTSQTISGTAVKSIVKFDGSTLTAADARAWTPTGGAYLTIPGAIASLSPDVLQVFTEAEAASFTVPSGVTAFPYGFMVRHATETNTRTLAANPGVNQFDGFVTFAFKIPLATSDADDAYSVVLMAMAVDDSQTRITQSVEEQNAAGQAAFEARATALSASGVTLLTNGGYGGTITKRTLCGVRSAGTASAPLAYVNGAC